MSDTAPPAWWVDRFWSKAKREGTCLIWQRGKTAHGRPVVCTKTWPGTTPQEYAHRVAYRIANGPIPNGMLVCHTCDTPACIEPTHLFLGTHLDNIQDCVAKGRHHGYPARLTPEAIAAMRHLYAEGGVTFYDLGDQFGVSFQHAHAVVRGNRRSQVR